MSCIIFDNNDLKLLRSENYNFNFDRKTGFFARWGKKKEDDPQFSEYGPEIADIEISTICHGVPGVGVCKFCYKSNTPKGENMTLETFKKLFTNLPKTVTQIAFGIGDIDSNPDMWNIFQYSRDNGVVPNVTVNGAGITDEVAKRLASVCGAVAVSLYDTDVTFDAIKRLTDAGMTQVNIHFMVSEQTYVRALNLMVERMTDSRLAKMNAIVYLGLKPKGRACNNFNTLSQDKFKRLVDIALESKIPIGFDSCSAFKFIRSIEGHEKEKEYTQASEPCEACCFSSYVNTKGEYFPCSFMEGETGWEEGIDAVNCENFLKEVWHNERTKKFRDRVVDSRTNGRNCAHYDI
jgi:hypothetical protein